MSFVSSASIGSTHIRPLLTTEIDLKGSAYTEVHIIHVLTWPTFGDSVRLHGMIPNAKREIHIWFGESVSLQTNLCLLVLRPLHAEFR